MSAIPAYRPTGSPLHATRAGVAALYCAAPSVVALLLDSPLALGGMLAGVAAAGVRAGVGRQVWLAARLAIPLALLVALINPIASRRGLTVLFDGPTVPLFGNFDVTLEALAYGAVSGLRVLVVAMAAALFSAAVDPDELLRLARRLAPRSALTASLATRLVPLLGRDATRLSEAYGLRAAPPARASRVRRGAILTRALAAGALERSVDMAAALEVRGYSIRTAGRRRARVPEPWSRWDTRFGAATVAVIALAAGIGAAGLASFEPYPLVHIEAGPADLVAALGLGAAMALPFGFGRTTPEDARA